MAGLAYLASARQKRELRRRLRMLSRSRCTALPPNENFSLVKSCLFGVPAEGLEPTRPCGHWILSPARLPIPPRRHRERNIGILPVRQTANLAVSEFGYRGKQLFSVPVRSDCHGSCTSNADSTDACGVGFRAQRSGAEGSFSTAAETWRYKCSSAFLGFQPSWPFKKFSVSNCRASSFSN
jgi:hypothetical protein